MQTRGIRKRKHLISFYQTDEKEEYVEELNLRSGDDVCHR
jgi:hypothetical protein